MESNAREFQTAIVKRRLQLHAKELRSAARREVLDEDDVDGRGFQRRWLHSCAEE